MPDDYSGIIRNYGETPLTAMHPSENLNVDDVSGRLTRDEVEILTGDVRRQYNFGDSYTEITRERDPFLHMLNKWRKKPTNDPEWKYRVKRNFAPNDRYGYIVGIGPESNLIDKDSSMTLTVDTWADAAYREVLDKTGNGVADYFANSDLPVTANSKVSLLIMGDYKISGNLHNLVGKDANDDGFINLGDPGTRPNYFLENNIINIPTGIAPSASATPVTGFCRGRILSTYNIDIYASDGTTKIAEGKVVNVKMVKVDSTNKYPTSLLGATWNKSNAELFDVSVGTGSNSIAEKLAPARTMVSGSAFHELSGYTATYMTQPYSSDTGLNQIFKGAAVISGRAMATERKYEKDPRKEQWGKVSRDVNYDIAHTAYFGEQFTDDDGLTYTEGLVTFTLNNGHRLSLDTTSKTIDDFLDDFSAITDMRQMTNFGSNYPIAVPTKTWNWLAKYGGFMANNAEISDNFRVNFLGFKVNRLGIPYRQLEIDGKIYNFILDTHLDETYIKAMMINMTQVFIRPLIGNGVNRDFTIYPSVKSIRHGGEDYTVDLAMADIGFEFTSQEGFVAWT